MFMAAHTQTHRHDTETDRAAGRENSAGCRCFHAVVEIESNGYRRHGAHPRRSLSRQLNLTCVRSLLRVVCARRRIGVRMAPNERWRRRMKRRRRRWATTERERRAGGSDSMAAAAVTTMVSPHNHTAAHTRPPQRSNPPPAPSAHEPAAKVRRKAARQFVLGRLRRQLGNSATTKDGNRMLINNE